MDPPSLFGNLAVMKRFEFEASGAAGGSKFFWIAHSVSVKLAQQLFFIRCGFALRLNGYIIGFCNPK
jgi:hypothetical protein